MSHGRCTDEREHVEQVLPSAAGRGGEVSSVQPKEEEAWESCAREVVLLTESTRREKKEGVSQGLLSS